MTDPAASPLKLLPEDWRRLRALLDEGLAQAPAERDAWLRQLGAADHPLRGHLQRLLQQGPAAGAALDALPRVETADFAKLPQSGPAHRVGPYRLLHEIGSGGMASVWLAERTDVMQARQVALKLPHLSWRQAGLAQRLAREREILATLDHPNIARLYDAGLTDDGQPWVALEFVRGERIDTWCQRHAAALPVRLRLFVQVVQAVAHAHAHLVVHRDIKPANILVDDQGQAKLLDFGIAKLLDAGLAESTELTQLAGRAYTPQYASPEQLRGEPLSTATDIFSLGVLLYELLTGRRPFGAEAATRLAVEQAVLDQQPVRPSLVAPLPAWRRALAGDLDTIVLKALKKQQGERYATAQALADDIQRHLAHQPVLARPDSTWYRTRRFISRHRLPVAAASAIALALCAGSTLALWQAQQARLAQARAEEQARAAERAQGIADASTGLSDFIANDLAAQRTTSEIAAQLDRAAQMVGQQYAGQPVLRAHLLYTLAGRHRRMSNFARWRVLASEAEAAARQAGEGALAADIACKLARDTAQAGAVREAQQTVTSQITWLEAHQPDTEAQLLGCLADASALARLQGDGALAVDSAERMRDIERRRGAEQTAGHGETLVILARAYALVGRHADALATLVRARDLYASLQMQESVQSTNLQIAMATVLREAGQPQRAMQTLAPLLRAHQDRRGAAHSARVLQVELALSQVRAGDAAGALPALQAAHGDAGLRADATLHRLTAMTLVSALLASGRPAEARQVLHDAEPAFAGILTAGALVGHALHLARAETALAAGDARQARQHADAAVALAAPRGDAGQAAMRRVHRLRAQAALHAGAAHEAVQAAAQALAIARRQALDPESSLHVGEDLALLALARHAAGDTTAAERDRLAAQAQLQATAVPGHPALQAPRVALGLAPGVQPRP